LKTDLIGKFAKGLSRLVNKDSRISKKVKLDKAEDEEDLNNVKKDKVHSKRMVHINELGLNYDKYLPFNNVYLNENYILVK
jgi:hypothetical protein